MPLLIYSELACISYFDLLKLNSLDLSDSVHVLVIHVVNIVRGAGCEDDDSLQNRNDKLRVQACLKEGVHLVLFDQLFKLIVLYHLASAARGMVPHVLQLHQHNPIPHSTQSDNEAKESDAGAIVGVNEVCCANVARVIFDIILIHEVRLRVIDERPLK